VKNALALTDLGVTSGMQARFQHGAPLGPTSYSINRKLRDVVILRDLQIFLANASTNRQPSGGQPRDRSTLLYLLAWQSSL